MPPKTLSLLLGSQTLVSRSKKYKKTKKGVSKLIKIAVKCPKVQIYLLLNREALLQSFRSSLKFSIQSSPSKLLNL